MSKRAVADEFDGLDTIEKAAVEAALNRCRVLAGQIESKLRNKRPEHFVDELSLADFCASLERAADVLGQKTRQSGDNTPKRHGASLSRHQQTADIATPLTSKFPINPSVVGRPKNARAVQKTNIDSDELLGRSIATFPRAFGFW